MFQSILYPEGKNNNVLRDTPIEALGDLHLDQLLSILLEAKKEYDLKGYYYTPLTDKETILYRQGILKDLLHPEIRNVISVFSNSCGYLEKKILRLREMLSMKPGLENNYLTKGELLSTVETYTESLRELHESMKSLKLESDGLKAVRWYLADFIETKEFKKLSEDAKNLRQAFDSLSYSMYIKNEMMRIYKSKNEDSLTEEILATFSKFRQDNVKDYSQKLAPMPYEKRIEIDVLNVLMKIYPEEFKELDLFTKEHSTFEDKTLLRFSREVQFYLAWISETESVRESDLCMTAPVITDYGEAMEIDGLYDLALAEKSTKGIVTNSIELKKGERIMVITGPNQGGKTTYARSIGQIHYLASLGLDVPASYASIALRNPVLTHFEREESIDTLNGKLADELERLYQMKDLASEKSLVLINEIFASTTSSDAVELGLRMMKWLESSETLAVVVTFLDELAASGSATVSLMCGIESEENHERTHKIVRKSPDGHAYAMDIAEKYGLTASMLERRLTK